MIQGYFQYIVGPETIRSFCSHFCFVVETLYTAKGNLSPGSKPVEQERLVIADHFCHFFHRFEPGAHGPCAPLIEEFSCPSGEDVLPETLKILLEQVRPDRFQVTFEQIAQPVHLVVGQIFRSFQQAPAASGQHGLLPLSSEFLGFLGSDLINGFVHVAHYMEPVENIDRSGSHLGDYPQIGLPHITTDKPQALASFGANPFEKDPERSGCAIAAYPKQTSFPGIELIDQGNELLFPLSPANLIGTDGTDVFQITMDETPFHSHLDRSEDILPSSFKGLRDIQPGKTFCPAGKEPSIGDGQMLFPFCPGNPFDLNAAIRAVDPSHGIEEENSDAPQGNELKATAGLGVIAWAGFAATRADWPTGFSWSDFYFQGQSPCLFTQMDRTINKTFVQLDPIQYSFDLHPVSPLLVMDFFVDLHYAKMVNGMLSFQTPSGNNFSLEKWSFGPDGTHRFC